MSTNSSILAIPQIFLSSPVENVLVGQSKGTDHGVKNSECTADRKEALRHTATSSNQCSSERRRRNKVVSTSSHFTASHLQAQSVPCALEKATECSPPAAPTAAPVPHKVRPVVRRRSPALSTMELLTAGPKISKTHGIALLRVTLFFSCILLVLCLHTEQLLAKGQLVHDCKSTPSLRNGNAQFLVNEVRKFVDNCIKTKDGIRFRKRLPSASQRMANSLDSKGDELEMGDSNFGSSSETDSTQLDAPESLSSTARSVDASVEKKSKYEYWRDEAPRTFQSRPVMMLKGRPFGRPPALILAAYLKDLPYRTKGHNTHNHSHHNNRIWPGAVKTEDSDDK